MGKTNSIWRIRWLDSATIKEEANGGGVLPLAFAEGVHELLELGGALNLEEDLVVVVGNFDVEVLGLLWALVLVGDWWAAAAVVLCARHCGGEVVLRCGCGGYNEAVEVIRCPSLCEGR